MGSKPDDIAEVPGSTCNPNTKMAARNTALANSGIAAVMMLVTEMARSSREPSRMPASTPSSSAIGISTAKVQKARIAVFQSRSEEHTSEHQTLMRISYAVFCLTKKNTNTKETI